MWKSLHAFAGKVLRQKLVKLPRSSFYRSFYKKQTEKKSLLLTRNTSNIFLETVCLIWMKTLQIFCFNFWSIFYFVTKFYFQPLKTNLSLIIFLLTKRLWCWYLDIHKFSFDPAKKCSVLCNGELCTWFDKLEFSFFFFSWYGGCRLSD